MNIFMKKSISAVVASFYLANMVTSSLAKSLDDQAGEFYKTQTGSHLKHMFPHKKPEEAIKAAIDKLVTDTRDDDRDKNGNVIINPKTGKPLSPGLQSLGAFDYNNKTQEINKIFERLNPLFQNEIDRKNTHSFFYNGHSNAFSLYLDTLEEFWKQSSLYDKVSPFSLKDNSKIKNVDDFLANFQNEFSKDYAKRYLDAKKAKAPLETPNGAKLGNYGKSPWNDNKNLGVTYAPDSIDYAREHLKSANLSLFGNQGVPKGENTLFFWLSSSNICNPSDFLIKRVLEWSGLADSNPAALQNQINAYKNIFNQKFQNAGGGLIQIAIKKDEVDKLGYASWAKGIPYYMDTHTGKLATRDGSNDKAFQLLTNGTKRYVRPKLSTMLDLYKKDFAKFSATYSHKSNSLNNGDRFQARLFINNEDYSNPNKVMVTRTFRNIVNSDNYKAALKKQMQDDFANAISKGQLTSKFHENKFNLTKVINYVFDKSSEGLKSILKIVENTTTTIFNTLIVTLEEVAKKIGNLAGTFMKKVDTLLMSKFDSEMYIKLYPGIIDEAKGHGMDLKEYAKWHFRTFKYSCDFNPKAYIKKYPAIIAEAKGHKMNLTEYAIWHYRTFKNPY